MSIDNQSSLSVTPIVEMTEVDIEFRIINFDKTIQRWIVNKSPNRDWINVFFYRSAVRTKRIYNGKTKLLSFLRDESIYYIKRYCQVQNEDLEGWVPKVKPSNFGSFEYHALVQGTVSRVFLLWCKTWDDDKLPKIIRY